MIWLLDDLVVCVVVDLINRLNSFLTSRKYNIMAMQEILYGGKYAKSEEKSACTVWHDIPRN